jgi:hypothetical protein
MGEYATNPRVTVCRDFKAITLVCLDLVLRRPLEPLPEIVVELLGEPPPPILEPDFEHQIKRTSRPGLYFRPPVRLERCRKLVEKLLPARLGLVDSRA